MFRITPQRQEIYRAIVDCAKQGMRGPELSAKFGLHKITICRICREAGARLKAGRARVLPDAMPRPCVWCGNIFTPERKHHARKYCCIACCGRARCTPERNREIGRTCRQKISDARRMVAPLTKGYRKLLGRHEHRVMMEQIIGRKLLSKEIVHHINGNKADNRPENLMLLAGRAEHAKIHDFGHNKKKKGDSNASKGKITGADPKET